MDANKTEKIFIIKSNVFIYITNVALCFVMGFGVVVVFICYFAGLCMCLAYSVHENLESVNIGSNKIVCKHHRIIAIKIKLKD